MTLEADIIVLASPGMTNTNASGRFPAFSKYAYHDRNSRGSKLLWHMVVKDSHTDAQGVGRLTCLSLGPEQAPWSR